MGTGRRSVFSPEMGIKNENMPNWCYTSISIESDNKDGVKPLYDNILKWQEEGTKIENSWGNDWLGLLVEKGLEVDPVNSNEYSCRGQFYDLQISNDGKQLSCGTETAWGPMNELWIALIDKYIPGAKFIYTAEESGMEVYITNDPDMTSKFYIDSWGKIEPEWSADEGDVRDVALEIFNEYNKSVPGIRKFLRDTIGCKRLGKNKVKDFFAKTPIGQVIRLINEEFWEASEVAIHEWEYCEP